jgi:hypothetical protein
MEKEKDKEDIDEAKELLKEGLDKIWKATKKVSGEVVKGFKEGYEEDPKKKDAGRG